MNRAYHQWFSTELQRQMELLVFGHGGRAVVFFPTRMARFYDYENWGVIGALFEQIENGELQVFCVDSIDAESFYNKQIHPAERIKRHLQYEAYIINEVLPFMQAQNGSKYVEAAGCSMGAYHAVNLAFKYPQLFNKVVGMSGRYDLTIQLPDYDDLFDGYHNEDIYFNMPLQYMANLQNEAVIALLQRLEIIITIGETDPFLTINRRFDEELRLKNIPHQFHIWDNNAHKPRYWRQMVKLYF